MEIKLPFFKKQKPAIFELHRFEDAKKISGVGHVLDGVVFPDGTTVVRWVSKHKSTAIFTSYREFERTHISYHGSSEIRWLNGFHGLEFTYTYLQGIVTVLNKIAKEASPQNKYIVAKLSQTISKKVTELKELRNGGNEISITQDRKTSQTSISRIGLDTESFTSPPEGDDSITEVENT